jgi:hypothetical protein
VLLSLDKSEKVASKVVLCLVTVLDHLGLRLANQIHFSGNFKRTQKWYNRGCLISNEEGLGSCPSLEQHFPEWPLTAR